jgi:MFS family permease
VALLAAALAALVAAPLLAWHVLCLAWAWRWQVAAAVVAAEVAFYWLHWLPKYEAFNAIPRPCQPPGYTPQQVRVSAARDTAHAQ